MATIKVYSICLSTLIVVALTVPLAANADGSTSTWEHIQDVSMPFWDRNGVWRIPGCSGGPESTADGMESADTAFSFFIRKGDPNKLALIFDGGGACWDKNTCIDSALTGDPVYELEIDVDKKLALLNAAGGVADLDHPANPVGDYTQVFIPYCTGDLHIGSQDTTYQTTDSNGVPLSWTIHHRGFDNVVTVLEWLVRYYRGEVGHPPQDVFLMGLSAGGYGVQVTYPAVDALLPPFTRVRLLADSAYGVITQDFYDRALSPEGAWGVWNNLAPVLEDAMESDRDAIAKELIHSLGSNYPLTRFGQYSRAFDRTQIFYYNVAKHLDSPELWNDPGETIASGLEWTVKARLSMVESAVTTLNYRFYFARGAGHTIFANDRFYTEDSADGERFSDWVDDMVNRPLPFGGDWRNATCMPDCVPPGGFQP